MKRLIAFNLLITITMLFSFVSHATDDVWVEKIKTVARSYPLKPNQKVSITNSFGEVKINSWEKAEAKILVTIKVSANSEAAAEQLINEISIQENNSSTISLETKFGNQNAGRRSNNRNNNSKMEINYEVTLPSYAPLYVKNSFGKTYISSRNGQTELKQSFGDIEIGTLTNLEEISVEFGRLVAQTLENSRAVFKYSSVKIDNLSGKINSRFEFCRQPKLGLSKGLEDIKIDNSYSDITILIPSTMSAVYNIKTSFGDVQNKSHLLLKDETSRKEYGPVFDKKFTGQSGNGKTTIYINSNFGKITLDNK